MQSVRLSARLQTVLEQIPAGTVLADIGTDHAYLPIAAVLQGRVRRAIAGDVRNGPWQMAMQHIQEAGVGTSIDVRLGDGLEVLQTDEAEVITICGMGGSLMRDLLAKGQSLALLGRVDRLVLQPNIGEPGLRSWLRENGWEIIREQWLEEDGYVYPVITADRMSTVSREDNLDSDLRFLPTERQALNQLSPAIRTKWIQRENEWLDWFGAHNLLQPTPAWLEKWHREARQMQQMLRSLEKAESEDALRRRDEVAHQFAIIQEVLQWLQPQDNSHNG